MYLLDTNIVVFLFRGDHEVAAKIDDVQLKNCFISEITVAELKYGAEKSSKPKYHHQLINKFIENVNVISIFESLDLYALERVRLEKEGLRIDDFDLLIGTSAVRNNLIMVTNNSKHLNRIKNIKIEDWTK